MMRRPRRPLSGEERRLWAEVVRFVRPLAGPLPEPESAPAPSPRDEAPTGEPIPPAPGPSARAVTKHPPPKPLVGLERRTVRALARGRVRPEGTLDLHGLTQVEAHARLVGFLRRSQDSGHGLVLIITGRGASGQDRGERGVLRRMVPHWLGLPELRSVVLGFDEAGPRQGGAGALHVRLRRRAAGA